VEEAINQLKSIAESQNIQSKRLIQSVVDLFYDNWGRKDGEFILLFKKSFLIKFFIFRSRKSTTIHVIGSTSATSSV
jgi:hypothetical protein